MQRHSAENRRTRTRVFTAMVVLLGVVANVGPFASAARAEDPPAAEAATHAASLNGHVEVDSSGNLDAGDLDGSGFAEVAIDDATDTVCIAASANDIASVVTGWHIHSGAFGVEGPILVDFTSFDLATSSLASTCVVDTDADAIAAAPTNFYVNVHSTEFTAGAIRGQLALPAEVDLEFSVSTSSSQIDRGQSALFDVMVRNNGPADASGFEIHADVSGTLAEAEHFAGFPGLNCAPDNNGTDYLRCQSTTPLAAGATIDGTFSVLGTDVGTLDMFATPVHGGSSVIPENDDNSAQTTVVEPSSTGSDLGIDKILDCGCTPELGGTFYYRIDAWNVGPDAASSVGITDTIPTGLIPNDVYSSQGTCDPITGQTVTCDFGSMPSGNYVTVWIGVQATAAGPYHNEASLVLGSGVVDVDLNDNIGAVDHIVATGTADLSIYKYTEGYYLAAGREFRWILEYENDGTATAEDVVITDTIPTNAAYVGATDPGCAPNTEGTQVICEVGDVPADNTARFVALTFLAPSAPDVEIYNQVSISSSTPESYIYDNEDQDWAYTYPDAAQIEVYKWHEEDQIGASDLIEWGVEVYNSPYNGGQATNVVMTDTLPAGATFDHYEIEADDDGYYFGPARTCGAVGQVVTCQLGDIHGYSWVDVHIFASAPIGTYFNDQASATSDQSSFGPASDGSGPVEVVADSSDVSVSLNGSPATVDPSGEVVYDVTVSNDGPSAALDVVHTQTLPDNATFGEFSDPNDGGCCSGAPAVVIDGPSGDIDLDTACTFEDDPLDSDTDPDSFSCALGAIPRFESIDFAFSLHAGATTPDTIVTTSTVSSTHPDPDLGNNTDTETTNVSDPSADVAAYSPYHPSSVLLGGSGYVTGYFINYGPSTARDVDVSFTIPSGFNPSSWYVYNYSTDLYVPGCVLGATAITCDSAGDLANGDVIYYELYGSWDELGDQTVVASGSSPTTPDPDLTNNPQSQTTTVQPLTADLALWFSQGDPDGVQGESTYQYAYFYNYGPHAAPDAVVTIDLPSDFTLTSYTAYSSYWGYMSCTQVGQQLTCDMGYLHVGGYLGMEIQGTFGSANPSTTVFTVSSATATDPVPTNNSFTNNATVLANVVDLGITKEVLGTANRTDPVEYRVKVTNHDGPQASGVQVVDTLPANSVFQYVDARDNGDYYYGGSCTHDGAATGGAVTCDLSDIPSGQSAYIHMWVRPTSVADLVNNATVTHAGTEADPNSFPNTAQLTTVLLGQRPHELYIDKYEQRDPWAVDENQTFRIDIGNYAEGRAQNVVVTDVLHSGLQFVSATDAGGGNPNCTHSGEAAGGTITCTIGDLEAYYRQTPGGGAYYRNILVTVKPLSSAPAFATLPIDITNTASVTATGPEGNPSYTSYPNSDATTITVESNEADLLLDKYSPGTSVVIGNRANFYFGVHNYGPATATGVSIVDTIPVDGSGNPLFTLDDAYNMSCTVSGDGITVTCPIGDLGPNSGSYHELYLTAGNTTGDFVNAASVSSAKPDPDPNNSSDTEPVTIAPDVADLRLTNFLQLDADPVVGEPFAYYIDIHNLGPAVSTNTTMTVQFPPTWGYTTIQGWSGGCDMPLDRLFKCEWGNVERNDSRWVQIGIVAMPDTGSFPLTASVTGGKTDPVPANNSQSLTTVIDADDVDLHITKAPSRNPAVRTEPMYWDIQVTNSGPGTATDVNLTDTLPSGVTYDSVTTDQGTCQHNSGVISCELGSLLDNDTSGDSANVRINVVPTVVTNSLSNTASVTTTKNDLTADNSATSVSAVADNRVDLSASKSAVPNPGVVDHPQYFQLQVYNAGPATATAVTLEDEIPLGFEFVSLSNESGAGLACTFDGGSRMVTCLDDVLPAGNADSVHVNVIPTAVADDVLNRLDVDAAEAEVAVPSYPNFDELVFDVLPNEVDIELSKTVSRNPGVVGEPQYYNISVYNNSHANASNVVVNDTIPDVFDLASDVFLGSSGDADCSASVGRDISCSFAALSPFASRTVRINVVPNAAGNPIVNTADSPELANEMANQHADNTDSVTSRVVTPQVDLQASKDPSPDVGVVGEQQTWTLSVTNHGPALAEAVTLDDTFISNLRVDSVVGSVCEETSDQVVHCDFGDLANSQTRTATVVVTPQAAGTGSNSVTVGSATPEVLNPAYPNTYTINGLPVVNDEVDLAPFISTDMHGRVGRPQQYYIEVGNYWFGGVTNAELEATIPAGMTITGIGAKTSGLSCSTTDQVVTCVKPSLGSGQSMFAYINVTPNAIGLQTASVVSDSVEVDVNPGNDSFSVTSKTSAPPIPSLEVEPPSGVFPLPVTAHLDATDPEGDAMYFELLWGDGGFNNGPLTPGMTLDHTYTQRGPFVVTLYVYDLYQHASGASYLGPLCGVTPEPANCGKDVQVVQVDLPTPLEAIADPALSFTTVNAPRGIHLNGADSSPLAGITAMDWSVAPPAGVVGTGYPQTFSGAVTPELHFTQPGTYTATLTVHSGTETQTDTAMIEVGPEPEFEGLKVHVRRADNNALIGGADVLVIDAEGTHISDDSEPDTGRTDYGTAFLHGLADGEHTVYVLAEGFKPNEAQAVVSNDFGEITVFLEEGGIVAAVLSAERLTPQEAIDLGVDPEDPDNQNVYEFEINLAFDTFEPVPFSGYVTPSGGFSFGTGFGGGGGGGGGCSGFTCQVSFGGDDVQISIVYVEDVPTITYMVIPGKAKWLKEFYKVEMTITNLGSGSFVLQDGVAQLNLPSNGGLGLPALFGQQQDNPVPVPDIPGGESEKVSWIVRGDAEGMYGGPANAGSDHDLTATYTGVLSPITKAVSITAALDKPIKVWGLSAVRLEVDADDAAFERHPYHATVRIRNVTDEDPDAEQHIPLYNLSLELLTGGTSNFIYQPGQQLLAETPSLEPGDFIEIDATLIPTFTGTLNLEQSFVRKSGSGENDDTAIITDQAAIPLSARPSISGSTIPGGVHLEWDDIVGETGWEIYSTPDTTTHFSNPPVETLPADVTEFDFGYPEGIAEFVVTPIVDDKQDMRHQMVQVESGGTVANNPPVAEDATASVGHKSDAGVDITPVVSDLDGNPLTYSLSTDDGTNGGADHGLVTLNDDDVSWHYEPVGDFVGDDTFTYRVSDGFATDTGVVTVTLTNSPPVANDDFATTITTNPVKVAVLVNDTDPDGENPVLLASTGLSVEGAGVHCNAVGKKCTYTPTGSFTGDDEFSYSITDAHGGTVYQGTVHVTVEPAPLVEVGKAFINEGNLDGAGSPVVSVMQVPITVTGTVGQPVVVEYKTGDNSAKVSQGDYQAKAGTLTFTEAGTQLVPVNVLGDVVTENNEKFWMYLSSATNAVRVNTRNGQTILDDDGVVVADASGTVGHLDSAGVDIALSATHPAGGTPTFALVGANGGAARGTASITGSTLHYAPTGHPTMPSDTVKYTATINGDTSAVATANITLTNTAPVAVDDEFTAASGFGTTLNVMANESPDADGENPVMVPTSGPTAQGGSYSCSSGTGMCTYTSATGFVGDDTFDYVIDDVHGGVASVGTVVVHVQGLAQFTLAPLGAVLEPDTGETIEQSFRVTLTGTLVGTARVTYKTGSNSAIPGSDYVAETDVLEFTSAGFQDFTVTVNGDNTVEPNERYWTYLQNPYNAELSPSYVRQGGIITNDD